MTDGPAGRARRDRPRWARALPFVLVGLAAAVGIVAAVCSGGSDDAAQRRAAALASPHARSSSIVVAPGDRAVWVASPDDDSVVEVSTASLARRRRVAVPGQPTELALAPGDDVPRLVVTRAQASAVTVLDVSRSSVYAETIPVPCGGTRSVAVRRLALPLGEAVDLAAVTCPTDDRVVLIDLLRDEAVARLDVAHPLGVASDGTSLVVTSAGDGAVRRWRWADLAGPLSRVQPAADGSGSVPRLRVTSRTVAAWADDRRSVSGLGALDVGPRGALATYQVVDNLRTVTAQELADGKGGYGTPLRGRARLEPALAGSCGARFADFTRPGGVLSGPVALAAVPASDLVWVVGQFSHTVAVVRCSGTEPSSVSPIVALFRVGAGARGIALMDSGRSALVDVGFDHSVARLVLPSSVDGRPVRTTAGSRRASVPDRVLEPALVVRRPVNDRYLSPLAQEGRRMFADATDTHLTPSGVVTCASCHPAAGSDGLSWRIQTDEIARKLRRTPDVWALPTDKPLHWDGSVDADHLVAQTVRELLGGDGLLVDPAPMEAYLREVRPPPARPAAGSDERASVARGRRLYESAEVGCAACHTGAAGSDGKRHRVLSRSSEPDARITATVTPVLSGVRGRAPFFHDGRAPDLRELLVGRYPRHGRTTGLTREQVDDLLAYLATR